MKPITKPISIEYPKYFHTYISLAKGEDLVAELKEETRLLEQLINSIPEEQGNYKYAPEKWSVKTLLLHIIDTERIMSYRALTFSRKDKTELPGFDENLYADNCEAEDRTLSGVLEEFIQVRNATISLFKNMSATMLTNIGTANRNLVTVKAIGYIILGHQIHHVKVLKERYNLGIEEE